MPAPRSLLGLLWLAGLAAAAARAEEKSRPHQTVAELSDQVEQTANQLRAADNELKVVEAEYSQRAEPSDEDLWNRRFSEGEIQYLLGDYINASVLFYDLIEDAKFKGAPHYTDALFYLADALYQQKNYLGARLYLRELLSQSSMHYRVAVARFIDIAGRLNDFTGLDEYVARAKDDAGNLPPDIAYVYGKWFFRRSDLSATERLKRAAAVFTPLAQDAKGPFHLQSEYFLGVGDVQAEDYAAAAEKFRHVAAAPDKGEREIKVKQLAQLSLARVLVELGQFDQALDAYQEIPQDSEYFVESLFEVAWTQVKKGQFEHAKGAADIITMLSPESTLAPEAQMLQAHLLLKLQRYAEATDAYNSVIATYRPVRDQLEALLKVNSDPITYFDNLLARNEGTLDVNSLLPPVAVKWATTQREVSGAVQIVSDLEAGHRGITESEQIAARIFRALEERGLETFPALQEGYTRAEAIDSGLAHVEESLVRIERSLVDEHLSPEQRAEIDAAQDPVLKERFSTLPSTVKELEDRKKRMQERVDEVDRQAFKLEYELQSMSASIAAIDKWLEDTRSQRSSSLEDEKIFRQSVSAEAEQVAALRKQLEQVRAKLTDERANADAAVSGEDAIRADFWQRLKRQHDLLSPAEPKAAPDAGRLIGRAHEIRLAALGVRGRLQIAKSTLRQRVASHGRQIKNKLAAIRSLLADYSGEANGVSQDARQLVGRIAFDSFKRVRQQFYDLVLKADVGLVDVAFTRKQDKTSQVQNLSLQKDRDLRALDNEFREVLKPD